MADTRYPQDLSLPLEDYAVIVREPNARFDWPPLLTGHRSQGCWTMRFAVEHVSVEQASAEVADGVEFCRCRFCGGGSVR